MFAFKYENDILAECVTGFFIKNSEIHGYEMCESFGIMSAQ